VALDTYTSNNAIRAVLGVEEDELPDSIVDLEMYDQYLQGDLLDISANLPAGFATVVAIAEESRTAAQAKLYRAVKMFAPYSVAVFLGPSVPLMAQKGITDGKAALARFSLDPYKETLARVQAMYEKLRTALIAAYAGYVGSPSAAGTRTYFTGATPDYDPITGV
jgi:hypothetical protein